MNVPQDSAPDANTKYRSVVCADVAASSAAAMMMVFSFTFSVSLGSSSRPAPPSRRERPRRRRAAEHGHEISPRDMDCHVTLPLGHATKRIISRLDVLRCGISPRLTAALGQQRLLP